MESVPASRQIGVERLPAAARILPLFVLPLQHVLVRHSVRRAQVHADVIEFQPLQALRANDYRFAFCGAMDYAVLQYQLEHDIGFRLRSPRQRWID
jgi:hypothetical protein